jgi:hypothetical protein
MKFNYEMIEIRRLNFWREQNYMLSETPFVYGHKGLKVKEQEKIFHANNN